MGPPDRSAAVPKGDLPELEGMLVRAAPMLIMAVRTDGEVVYASPGVEDVIGFAEEELVGTNMLGYIHEDDAERAVMTMLWRDEEGLAPPGVTRFRVRHKARDWVDVETAGRRVVVGDAEYLALYARSAGDSLVAENILRHVVRGRSRTDALASALHAVSWADHGSRVAIAWPDDDAMRQVSTGLPDEITGIDPTGDGNPWAECSTSRASVRRSSADLPAHLRDVAAGVGLSEIWIEPVIWSDADPPALVTIWSRGGVHVPEIHGYGMRMACDFVELILRFSAQTRQLEEMATHDSLTGLANRRVFFERVEKASQGGAVLYCDLDHFKPVNEELGHAAGDELLRAAGDRMLRCTRQSDVVARLGGDEFGVLCDEATRDEAMAIARRLVAAFAEPFSLDAGRVSVGVTIGVGHSDGAMRDGVIERADQALRQAKSTRCARILADWERIRP